MKLQTRELTGSALAWAVAQAARVEVFLPGGNTYPHAVRLKDGTTNFDPVGDPAQGFLIVESAGIDLHQFKRRDYYIVPVDGRQRPRGAVVIRVPGGGERYKVPRKPARSRTYGKWFARMSVDSNPPLWDWRERDFMSDTALEAAMRCYVASELGDAVEVPDALLHM